MTVGVLQYISHPSLDEIYQGILTGLKQRGISGRKEFKGCFPKWSRRSKQVKYDVTTIN